MQFQKLLKLREPEIWRKNFEAINVSIREAIWKLSNQDAGPPVFIVGCSRSGTTVTYETIIKAREIIGFGYELPQFWDRLYGPKLNNWESEAATEENASAEFRDRFLAHCYARLGSGRILDKTCINVMRISFLNALFPEARFVFIHRDGRENVSSLIDGWRDGRFELGQFLGPPPTEVSINRGEFSHWHFFLPPGWEKFNEASLEKVCAYQWNIANRLALEAKRDIDSERWIELRYEDILTQPYDLFESVFAKLEFEFSPTMQKWCASLNKNPTSMVTGPPSHDKWKRRNPNEIEKIIPMIAPVMEELGRTLES